MGTLGSYGTNFARLWVQIKIYFKHLLQNMFYYKS